jgi:hypothetical protein
MTHAHESPMSATVHPSSVRFRRCVADAAVGKGQYFPVILTNPQPVAHLSSYSATAIHPGAHGRGFFLPMVEQ